METYPNLVQGVPKPIHRIRPREVAEIELKEILTTGCTWGFCECCELRRARIKPIDEEALALPP